MSVYTDFLADPQRQDLWLADLMPWDNGGQATVTLRVSTDQFATTGSDTPAHTPYIAALVGGPAFDTDAVQPGTLGLIPDARGGELHVGQRMGALDSWRSYDWSGQRCLVRHGGFSPRLGRSLTFAEMGTFEYEMDSLLPGLDELVIPLRDLGARFDQPLQTRRYLGTDFALAFTGVAGTYSDHGTPAKCNVTGNLTFDGRVWINSLANVSALLNWNDIVGANFPFRISVRTSGVVRLNAGGYAAPMDTTFALSTKRWYHIRIVRNGTAITFYILEEATGVETIETKTASAATGTSAAGHFTVSSASQLIDGIVDEMRLWNAVRTVDDWRNLRIRELTTAEAADATLVFYPKFNDAAGTTVTDSSGSPANGTITGANFVWVPALSGKVDLAGKVLPDCWGSVEDASPILVYSPTQIYQVHSRAANAIGSVYEGGAAITLDTAYTDLLLFLQHATTAAKFDQLICTDGTFIRLGSKPSKPISVTFSGDATGSYVSTAADITRRIVTSRGQTPLVDPTDLDTTSFTNLNTANSAVVGLYFKDDITIQEAVNKVLSSVGAVGWFGRFDKLFKVKRNSGTTGSPVITLTSAEIVSLKPIAADQPVWEENVKYRENYSVMTTDQMASGTIASTRQDFLAQQWRTINRPSQANRTRWKYARSETVETHLTTLADAQAEGDRRLALFGAGAPRAFQVESTLKGIQLERFDLVAVSYSDLDKSGNAQVRLGLSATNFLVLGIGERAGDGKSLLTIWRES